MAFRYAKALFEAARDAQAEEKVRQEIAKLGRAYRERPEVAEALSHPLLSVEEKKQRALAGTGALSPLTDRFLDLLLAKKRAGLLPDVASLYEDLWEKTQKILKLEVTSDRKSVV